MPEQRPSDLQAFEATLGNAEQYPLNLDRPQDLRSVLMSCNELIRSDWFYQRLNGSVWTWSTAEDGTEFSEVEKIDDLDGLKGILNIETRDPVCRFLYVQNGTSRTALGCSKEQLTWILSYRQVFPAIGDVLSAFDPALGSVRLETSFHVRTSLRKTQPRLDLPQIGRSNYRFEYCLRLVGVEKKGDDLTKFQHVAAYHSMDVKENRSLWLLFKARDGLRKQLEDESRFYVKNSPKAWSSAQNAFLANMNTNLVLFQWCSSNWTEYIDELDAKMRPIKAAVTLPRMDDVITERDLQHRDTSLTRLRRDTGLSHGRRSGTMSARPDSHLRRSLRWLSKRMQSGRDENNCNGIVPGNSGPQTSAMNTHRADVWFNFDELQKQHDLLNDCRSTLDALKSNIDILRNYQTYIRHLTASSAFQECVNLVDYEDEILERLDMVAAVEDDLKSHSKRLDRLIKTLENTINLFTNVLNYKEVRVTEHFTRHAQDSTTRMEMVTEEMHDIAKTTEVQTVSMHIITAVALFFLPVTFVAVSACCLSALFFASTASPSPDFDDTERLSLTLQQSFFDSNILDFSGSEKRQLGQWSLNLSALSLFFYVSIPIMVLVIMFWVAAVWWHRKRRMGKAVATDTGDPEKQITS